MIKALFEKDNSVVVVIENPNAEEVALVRRLRELEESQMAENPDASKASLFAEFRSVKAAKFVQDSEAAATKSSALQDVLRSNDFEDFEEFEPILD